MHSRPEERGAALLTVLMLVAVIAVIAAGALEKLRLATRLTANAVGIEQARSYAQPAEALAVTRISTLLGQSPDRVTLAGGWSNAPFGLPLPDGTAVARVTDGGNCFNLNSLASEVAPGVYVTNPIARVQLARLMRLLQVSPQVAEQVAQLACEVRGVMLERLGPVVWGRSVLSACFALEELEETARLWRQAAVKPQPLGDSDVAELCEVFAARW